jgi:hypothetical protein
MPAVGSVEELFVTFKNKCCDWRFAARVAELPASYGRFAPMAATPIRLRFIQVQTFPRIQR